MTPPRCSPAPSPPPAHSRTRTRRCARWACAASSTASWPLAAQELPHRSHEPVRALLGYERPAALDRREATLWQELGEPPAVVEREELVVRGPHDERRLVEAAQRPGRLERVAGVD